MDFRSTWGIYPWFVENTKKEYIHPEDLEEFKLLFPYGKVFFCISEDDKYIHLSYGEKIFRVKPDRYRKIISDGYLIGDIVEILNGSSQGKKATIEHMKWHYEKQKIMYGLKLLDSKIKSRRYYKEDFKLLK